MIMTMSCLNKLVTESVSDYFSNGYTLYFDENTSGSQSREVFSVHLTNDKGKNVTKIYGTIKMMYDYTSILTINVERFKNNGGIFWNGRGKLLNQREFYIYDNKIYTTDKKELNALLDLKEKRMKVKEKPVIILGEKYKKIILPWVKKQKGYKSIKISDIKFVLRKIDCYVIRFYEKNNLYIYLSNKYTDVPHR